LFCLARDPGGRLRDVAADVGITERAVQKIVRDLQDGGMISITKSGRRNRYRIHKKQKLRHELEANCRIRELIKVINKDTKKESSAADPVDQTGQSQKENTQGESARESRVAAEKAPDKDHSDSAKQKDTIEPKKPIISDSIEKQQGSLF
jgi:predicted transcriptional regulator